MKFLVPEIFYYAVPVLLLTSILFFIGMRRRKNLLQCLFGRYANMPDTVHVSNPRRYLVCVLLLAVLALLLTAAARPYWQTLPAPQKSTGQDVMVLFDVSRSMLAKDVLPSRFDHSLFMLRQLVKSMPHSRFGLIPFAGTAYLACPLTADHGAFEMYVNELSTASVPLGGTDLEKALRVALKAFEGADGVEHAVVIFTDGEELSGKSETVAEALQENGIRLFIVGVGDTGGFPVKDEKGLFRRDSAGNIVLSKLDIRSLEALAKASRGVFFHSTVQQSYLPELIADIKKLPESSTLLSNGDIPVEKAHVFLLAALAVLIVALLIPLGGRKKEILMLLTLAIPLYGQDAPEKIYNQALDLQKNQNAGFSELYEKVLLHPQTTPQIKAKTHLNLGVARHREARKSLADAEAKVKMQQLDAALKELENTRTALENSENYYAQSMSCSPGGYAGDMVATDLALLDADSRRMEELKKEIEKLKEQQQKAQQSSADAAKENQQKSGSDGNDSRSEAKSDKSSNQDNQPKGGDKQNDPAQSALDRARQETDKLKNAAAGMGQQKLQEQAEKAGEALKDAAQAQQKGDFSRAEQKINEALQALAPDKQGQNGSAAGENNKKNSGEKNENSAPAEKEPEKRDNSSEALLKLMENEESDRRKQINSQISARQVSDPERDW